MKIAILTVFNQAYAEIADVVLPVLHRYADRHGYGIHVGKYHTDPALLEDYGDRSKIALYKAHYDAHDILMFLDIDAIVMNGTVAIEDVLGDRPFLWTYDVNGPCSGFWIARCIPAVKVFLTAVAAQAQYGGNLIASEHLGPPHSVTLQMEPHGTSDQTMMRRLMYLPPFSDVAKHCVSGKEAGHCYDYREIKWPQEYDYLGHYQPGDWILTYPSVPLERRLELLRGAAIKAT